MLSKMYPPASASRAEYLLEVPLPDREEPDHGNVFKRGIILALLVIAAATIVLVVPESEDSYALDAADSEAPGIDDGTRLALATDAALSGAEYSLARSAAILPAATAAEQAKVTAGSTKDPSTSTTTLPTTTVAPKPAKVVAPIVPVTTVAPTTVPVTTPPAADSSSTDSSSTDSSSTDSSSTDSSSSAPDAAPAATDSDTPTASVDDSSTSSSVDDSSPPSSVTPEESTTTVAEETTTTTVAPAPNPNGFVDAGHGVLVPPVLLDIRYCESRGNYQAANPSSSARGAYQFLTGSWKDYGHKDRYGVSSADQASNAQQDEAALLTWERSGTTPWNASKSCWANR